MANPVLAAARRWLRYRQTLCALRALSPELLADIGLRQNDLARIAAQAAASADLASVFDLVKGPKRRGPYGRCSSA